MILLNHSMNNNWNQPTHRFVRYAQVPAYNHAVAVFIDTTNNSEEEFVDYHDNFLDDLLAFRVGVMYTINAIRYYTGDV